MCFLCLQVLGLLRSSSVRGPVYRAVVAVAEGMQARRSDVTSELVTKPLLGTLLHCLDLAGTVSLGLSVTLRFVTILQSVTPSP